MPPTHLNPGNKGKYFVLILQSQPRGQRIIETSSLDLTIPRGGRVDGLMRESLSSSLGQVQWGRWKCSGLSVPSSLAGWLSPVCCALHGPPQTPSNQRGLLTKGTATLSASPESSALGRGRSCHVPACFTLSQRGDSIHQNSSTKTSLQRPDYNLHHSAHPHVFQKPSLDTFSSCIPAFMGQAHGILSSDNLTIQMDSPWKEILSFSHYVMSDSMRPRRLQHTRLLCPPLSPRVCSDCIELVMSSNHLILCRPRLPLPSLFPSIRVFSNELGCIRWPKYWTFSISPSNEYSGLTSLGLTLISLQSKGLSRVFSNTSVQKHQSHSTIVVYY